MTIDRFTHLAVVGGGAWGTALAQVLTMAGHKVQLVVREAEVLDSVNKTHENRLFLPGVSLSPDIMASQDFAVLSDCDLILMVPPAQHMRTTLQALAPYVPSDPVMLLCAKGVERGTDKLMHHVAQDVLPDVRFGVLAGPNFAAEVARGLPAAVSIACETADLGTKIAATLAGPTFRPYLHHDLVGAEAGGAIKNVLAIACGITEGMGLGRNAHAALITRGYAEMTRFAVALGARAETMVGMCGLGDLVLTCSSSQSRNLSVGLALGTGTTLEEALSGKLSVAEGVQSAPAVRHLAHTLGVELPICNAVAAILAGETCVKGAIETLLSRPLKIEV